MAKDMILAADLGTTSFSIRCGGIDFRLQLLASPRSNRVARPRTFVSKHGTGSNCLNNVLCSSRAFKDKLKQNRRTRTAYNRMSSVPDLTGLSQELRESLRERVELADFSLRQVICKPEEKAHAAVGRNPLVSGRAHGASSANRLDTFWDEHLFREHFQAQAVGEQVRIASLWSGRKPLAFPMLPVEALLLSPGESFIPCDTSLIVTEDALLSGRRTSTRAAMDFVQPVRMKAGGFPAMLDLDKRTRYGDCVSACAATHDDGIARLIRGSPRFSKHFSSAKPEGYPCSPKRESHQRARRSLECPCCHPAAAQRCNSSAVLIAGIASRRPCHGDSGSEPGSFAQCHTYHDNSKECDQDRKRIWDTLISGDNPTKGANAPIMKTPGSPAPRANALSSPTAWAVKPAAKLRLI